MRKVLTEKDFSWPTEAELRNGMEQELRRLSRTTGTRRIATIEQERRAKEKEAMHPTHYPQTKLARGLDARNSPHSAAAMRAKRQAAKASVVTERKVREATAKAERKAKREAVSTDSTRITIVNKAFVFGREGSTRNACWQTCLRSKTVGDYLGNGGAKKYLARWEAAGAIRLG